MPYFFLTVVKSPQSLQCTTRKLCSMFSDCRVGYFSVLKWNSLEHRKIQVPCSLGQAPWTSFGKISLLIKGQQSQGTFLKMKEKTIPVILNDAFIYLSWKQKNTTNSHSARDCWVILKHSKELTFTQWKYPMYSKSSNDYKKALFLN